MLRNLDLTSWQGLLSTLAGLALITLIGVGIRLLAMMTIQQRRERLNRQINERLRTLIAAYKTLGGSFTGNLAVDPRHLRDVRREAPSREPAGEDEEEESNDSSATSDRSRRIRDAVEAALSDVILLGTEEHVRLAGLAAHELIEGRPIHVHELVVSLRTFIRKALDLDPVPPDLAIPAQGPARPSGAGGGRGKGQGEGGRQGSGRGGGGGMGGGMGMAGAGMGMGLAAGTATPADDEPSDKAHG